MPRNHLGQDQLELRATQLREAAEILPDGEERKGLMFRACRMEDASIVINKWSLSSRGLAARIDISRTGLKLTFADSDDLARVYRFDLAQDSEMISPTVPG